MSNNNDDNPTKTENTQNPETAPLSIFKQVATTARKARLETIGMASLAVKTGTQYLNDALETGKQSLEAQSTEESAEAAQASSTPTTNNELLETTLSRLKSLAKSSQQLSIGLAKKTADDQKELRKRLSERLAHADSEFDKQATSTITENTQADLEGPVKTTSWQSRYASLKAKRDSLLEWSSESAQQLLEEAEQEGKDLDLEFRKQVKSRQQDIIASYQNRIGKLGFATKNDLNDLNKKLIDLALLLEKQNSKKAGELINLERRRVERRKQQQPVEFDKRVYQRRS